MHFSPFSINDSTFSNWLEFEKFKSSKIHLSSDLFEKIQSTLYKMKIPTMIGVTEQDVLKYEEEKIFNPLFKKLFG